MVKWRKEKPGSGVNGGEESRKVEVEIFGQVGRENGSFITKSCF